MPAISKKINICRKLNIASFKFHVALNDLHYLSCQVLDRMSFNLQISSPHDPNISDAF